jgi:purine nucleosidase
VKPGWMLLVVSLALQGGAVQSMPNGPGKMSVVVISDMQPFGDDGVAIAMLALSGKVRLQAVVATSGNVWADQAGENIRKWLDDLHRNDVPVYVGFPQEHHRSRINQYLEDEQAETRYAGALKTVRAEQASLHAPRTTDDPIENPAVRYLAQTLPKLAQPVVIAVIGPATVLWSAIQLQPALRSVIERVYIMGGTMGAAGNANQTAEFNFWFDAAAANGVLNAGLPVTLIPLDATAGVEYDERMVSSAAKSTPLARYLEAYIDARRKRSRGRHAMWDEVLAGTLLDPALVSSERNACVTVETRRGATYGDTRIENVNPNSTCHPVKIVSKINADPMRSLLYDLLQQ